MGLKLILTLIESARKYPPKTSYCYSYFESRGGKFENVIFFGLQYIIKKYLTGVQVTEEKIQEVMKVAIYHDHPRFPPLQN